MKPRTRPYRLELESYNNLGPSTYVDEEHARRALRHLPTGTKWKITRRLTPHGRKTELIAEGVK